MKMGVTLDSYNEENCSIVEPIWWEVLESSIHYYEEHVLATHACPFPFDCKEVKGDDSFFFY